MEANVQFHAPAILCPGTDVPPPVRWVAVWAPGRWGEKTEIPCSCLKPKADYSVVQLAEIITIKTELLTPPCLVEYP
jgi:hypothetical protein